MDISREGLKYIPTDYSQRAEGIMMKCLWSILMGFPEKQTARNSGLEKHINYGFMEKAISHCLSLGRGQHCNTGEVILEAFFSRTIIC